jgi:hypothetical protein
MRKRNRNAAAVLGFAFTSWLSAAPAAAEEGQACDALFPDLQCGRSGRFEGFHKPIVQPYLFEDPFIVTGIYPYYVYHEFPDRSAMEGGDAQVTAVQARVAITDRFAFIATKDGYMWKHPDSPILDDTEGWMNLAGGFKYALSQDPEKQQIVSGVLRFEVPTGATDVYQGHGSGVVIPSITAAAGFGELRVMGDLGMQAGLSTEDSSSVFYHLYADYAVLPRVTPFVQVSGIHWIDDGDGSLPVDLDLGALGLGHVQVPLSVVESLYGEFEGADVLNLGSVDVEGLELYTAAIGVHIDLVDHVTLSVAYERPFSHHKGLFQQRVTSALSIEF